MPCIWMAFGIIYGCLSKQHTNTYIHTYTQTNTNTHASHAGSHHAMHLDGLRNHTRMPQQTTHTYTHKNTNTQALTLLCIWMTFAIIYGCLSTQRMSFLTALLFAVSSVSTDGCLELIELLGPDTPHGARVTLEEFDPANWAFVGIYLLFGAPFYLYTMGTVALAFMTYLSEEHQKHALHEQITGEEYQLMRHLGMCMYAYVCMCVCIYIYIYIYI
jgi:hypothetical protein